MIGIKGSGMTALAQYLKSQSKYVTGSDINEKFFTDKILNRLNISYFEGFSADNIPDDIDWVIYSAAYDETNPELKTVIEKGLPCSNYPEALGIITKDKYLVSIAGTHGKSTTTAMLGMMLYKQKSSPTIILGTSVPQFDDCNAYIGNNNVIILESCEYRKHFLNFFPNVTVITNIDNDHLDYFQDIKDIKNTFKDFILNTKSDGKVIVPEFDPNVTDLIQEIKKIRKDLQFITFGFKSEADYYASNLEINKTDRRMKYKINNEYNASINIPGEHNVLNSLAALSAAKNMEEYLHIDENLLLKGLSDYKGTKRRFDFKGSRDGIDVYDDYAHHPTEIDITLTTFRNYFSDKDIWCVFQPHTYTRTKALWEDFIDCFKKTDYLIINDIFASAREQKDPNVSSEMLVNEISKKQDNVFYISDYDNTVSFLSEKIKKPSIIVTMGAGNTYVVGEKFLNYKYSNRES